MKALSDCRLYAFVDTAYLHGRSPALVAEQLCEGGADLIQLRAKQVPVESIRPLAEDLLRITSRAGVGLVVNDYPQVACEIGAPYCHLGQEDFFDAGFTHVSSIVPKRPPVDGQLRFGLSSHAPDQALRAVAAGADYVAIGPVYATGTKPGAQPVTLEYVRWASAHLTLPWFAIGGINLDTVDDVLAAGAQRICVVSAILNAPNIARACREFRTRLG
ncbi:MAG TPA: thiamine phosphate synthase [Verrucomicrobiae bacterium]|nr:thiamine phosphate synthase [Verrucomicrobiae bacterium]